MKWSEGKSPTETVALISCPSHLFGFSTDPLSIRKFHDVLQYFRMDRLIEKYSQFL